MADDKIEKINTDDLISSIIKNNIWNLKIMVKILIKKFLIDKKVSKRSKK